MTINLDERYELLNDDTAALDDFTEARLASVENHLEDCLASLDAAIWNVNAATDEARAIKAVHLLARLAVLRDALENCAIDDAMDEVAELRP